MSFQEWWDSEERDADYFLPVIAEAAWNAAVAAERERCARLCEETQMAKVATAADWTRRIGDDLAALIRGA